MGLNMTSIANLTELKVQFLIREAYRWLGSMEETGEPNGGQIVSMFQNWDGHPDHVPWCMAFVQYCLKWAEYNWETTAGYCTMDDHYKVFPSEHCLTVWNKTPEECKTQTPEMGHIAIWAFTKDGKPTGAGHCGIVTGSKLDSRFFTTIEGNTKDGTGMNREGDGVYERVRNVTGSEGFMLLGFLKPWG